ncbi:MAG: ATP-dependent Clp protease ATP-binding subunit ClpC, partial [Patescibacteria group bacterium]|nr:ATP-dependent Clp protease ATP-binding subunit ClpC [Patescibacteria group bacterium]
YEKMKNDLVSRLKQELRPELVNRLDKIIVFHTLNKDEIAKIIDLNLKELQERLQSQGYNLKFLPKVKEMVAKFGYNPEYGARPIRRAISDLIEDPLSEAILVGKIKKDEQTNISFDQDKIVFEKILKKS